MKTAISTVLTAVLASALGAQNGNGFTFAYGDGQWGGSVALAGHANFTAANGTLAADLGSSTRALVRMDGNLREAFFVSGDVDAAMSANVLTRLRLGASLATELLVRIGGVTVYRTTSGNTAGLGAEEFGNVFGSRGFSGSVEIGPFSVALTGNATADVDFSLAPSLNLFPVPSVGLALTGTGDVRGTSSVSIGAFGVTVGISSLIDPADPTATIEAHTNFVTVGGSLSWNIPRIRVVIDVFATALGVTYRQRIANLDLNGTTGSLPIGL